MPKELRYKDKKAAFNIWLNDLRHTELNPSRYGFSFSDLDGIFIADRKPYLLWFALEVKTRGKTKVDSKSQRSILNLLNAVGYKTNDEILTFKIWGRKDSRQLIWFGVHLLVLSNETPDDSDWMKWDGTSIDGETLIKILRFENSAKFPLEKLILDRAMLKK